MPWLTVSVMPHQPIERTPNTWSNGGSLAAMPNMRKWCLGTGCCASALRKNGSMEAQVQRLRSAMSQKREAENFGISTTVPPAHMVGRIE